MKTKYFLNLLIIMILIGCNDNNHSSTIAGGGISGTGISVGPISALGSIFVNDIEFETDNALVFINKQLMTANDLKVGMVVQVEGIIQPDEKTGKASRVYFNDNVRGPVQQVDDETNTLKVLGQTVTIDQLTVLDNISELADLKVGEIVSVSGLIETNASIRATWLKRDSHLTEFEIVGVVANLDLVTQTFTMGDLTINYSQTLELTVPEGILQNGLLVEVKGMFMGTLTEDILMASQVETEDELLGAEAGTKIEIEGFITQFNSPFDFEVARLPVTTTSQTVFQWGNVEELAAGIKVEVEGELDANGLLILEEVSFQNPTRTSVERIEMEADVEAINLAKQEIILLGVPIQMTRSTQFRDKRDARVSFGLPNLSLGDRVAMSGFLETTSGVLTAEVLLREPFRLDGQVIVEGPVSHVDIQAGTLAILDIAILTNSDTTYENEGLDGMETVMTAEEFFTSIQQPEWLIEVQGLLIDNAILANQLEIERKPK